ALVLVAFGVSSLLILDQLRTQQSSFDLLTGVYVPFNARLRAAHLQGVRIGLINTFNNEQRDAVQKMTPGTEAQFADAMANRLRMVLSARRVLDEAFSHPDRLGGDRALEGLREVREGVLQLEVALMSNEGKSPVEILQDVRTQAEIVGLFNSLDDQTTRAINLLADKVRAAERRTETLTIVLTLGALAIALITIVGVILTLRPLRKLTSSVRQLGHGDWEQRIHLSPRSADEVRQLAHEFNLMAEALQERERRLIRGERMAAVGKLAAQVTHEIRNPLSSVALNVELLEDEMGGTSPEARQLLTQITAELDRLTSITEEYLGFARRQQPELDAMDLVAEVHNLLDFTEEEHLQSRIRVNREFADTPLWVLGDANQLRQALLNLLRNAREALSPDPADSHASTENPQITVKMVLRASQLANAPAIAGNAKASSTMPRSTETGNTTDTMEVAIEVADNGPGLAGADGEQDNIFEAFFTRKAHGTGLGLSIVQQIVLDHHGSVRVASTGSHGTTFEITLPACAPPATSVSSPGSIESA
ncbi:MAG: ATP-binding protein, partial [Nannocystaceae bacterium]